ncbi:MAG: hypothetical protein AAGC86_17260 [Pseudomonadota bacterium]
MAHRLALFLVNLALYALLAVSLSGLEGQRALSAIELDRASGTALVYGESRAAFCFGEVESHGDCPLCRLETPASWPQPALGDPRAAPVAACLPLPRDLALIKRARDATVQARAPPLA